MANALFLSPTDDASFSAARAVLQGASLSWDWVTSSPLAATASLAALFILLTWGLQVLTTNYSWVDRLWSTAPPLYALVYAGWSGGDVRTWLMAALVTAWGARLTFNFARKGGYDPKEEDYRWAVVRSWLAKHDPLHPLGRELFSLFFISIYQLVLIFLFTVPPLELAWQARGRVPPGAWDVLLAAAFLGFLVLETVTDQQQWDFQRAKHALTPEQRTAAGGDFARGFRTTGVFAWSRHMNFFAEFMQWWVFYGFTWAVGAPWLNWTVAGAFLLTLLFQGSTEMTERLSAGKYPEYVRYQRTTSRLIPLWPGPKLD
ncbi:MAG: hypothetical protein RL653_4408 [Pseudomonadota bacterium]